MYEVEVKVPASHGEVERRLRDADAERVERVTQVDTYYDAPHRDFAETDEALRLRQERRDPDADDDGSGDADDRDSGGADDHDPADAETTKITYKGPLIDAASKTREEHETAVADGDAAAAIFDGLGFEPAAVVEKEREFFDLDGYTVTLDRVDGLGEFVEVEAEASEGADVDSVREGAFDVLRRLGLDPDEQIRTSYLGLLLDDSE
ncbi:class IV adenylate cyclase [Halobellus limi]|uniref:Adenylate cyclase, class 2 n=1 Tax=Halobellus limi TaxID=699433 RepID=A0A1H5YX01_9EURY|nr:class IV adenylate cyclase [Halobellus limi]QCC48311.1 class IV adenylate cyclase [Halobellus limi]SEG28322.1 adenylate cyclase, class 2 [Halobellus limi]